MLAEVLVLADGEVGDQKHVGGQVVSSLSGIQEPERGWLLCNGAAVSRTTYAKLFALYGTTYGAGDGSTTFNLPNALDSIALGRGTVRATTGQRFGSLGHTHTVSAHSHTLGGHGHTMGNHVHDMSHGHTGNSNPVTSLSGLLVSGGSVGSGPAHNHPISSSAASSSNTSGPSTNSTGAASPDATSGLVGTPSTSPGDPLYVVVAGMLCRYA